MKVLTAGGPVANATVAGHVRLHDDKVSTYTGCSDGSKAVSMYRSSAKPQMNMHHKNFCQQASNHDADSQIT